MRHSLFFFLLVLGLFACSETEEETCTDKVDLSKVRVDIQVNRADQAIQQLTDEASIQAFFSKYPKFKELLLAKYLPAEKLNEVMLFTASNEKWSPLREAINNEFGDISGIENSLSDVFSHISYYFKGFKSPKVTTIYTNQLGLDMYIDDEHLFIGLDYFLADKENPMNQIPNMPNYILKWYTAEHLPFIVSQAVSGKYNNFNTEDQTVLAYMIFYGKAIYFKQKTIPCADPSEYMEWSEDEYLFAESFEKRIWGHFLQNDIFYKKDRVAVTKYVDPRPFCNEIADDCPGRIGQFLGWRIVQEYMKKNPKVTLAQLMAETDAQKIFQSANYKPKNVETPKKEQ